MSDKNLTPLPHSIRYQPQLGHFLQIQVNFRPPTIREGRASPVVHEILEVGGQITLSCQK